MLPLFTIFFYLIIALVLLLLVYILWGVLKLSRYRKQGPLPGRFKRALKFFEKEGSITREEYEDYLGISPDLSHEDLERLEALGFIEKVGKKDSYYHFIGKGKGKK